jgi:prepilin-type N-terminal cleavage/methylation domain-containing protein/prepilin-type processing-associated H-X9-DG protein
MAVKSSKQKKGFTLIELLVVIAVIAILAALLLPALTRAKATAQSAACKSNLHQIGLALRMYVDDFQKYPMYWDYRSRGASYWDFKLTRYTAGGQGVFNCPANSPTNQWSPIQPVFFSIFPLNKSYGYNALRRPGLIRSDPGGFNSNATLGLDPSPGYPAFSSRALPESSVLVPCDMVALMDYNQPQDDDGDGDLAPVDLLACLNGSRHDRGANSVFCDAHVEYAKTNAWTARNETARRRWNNDHQAHPPL